MASNGLIQIIPSSVVKAGTGSTATINATGKVDFVDCTSLSLENVFSSAYTNYMFTITFNAAANRDLNMRLRVSGADDAATSYNYNSCSSNGTVYSASGAVGQTFWYLASTNATWRVGATAYLSYPFAAKRTLYNVTHINDSGGALIWENCGSHGDPTSFTSVTIYSSAGGAFSGQICFYGFNE